MSVAGGVRDPAPPAVSENRPRVLVLAGSAERALWLMGTQRPALVITDLFMPGMSGFSLRGAMLRRQELVDIAVIVLSAFRRRPGETLDAFAALPKPLNVERLLDVVRRAVRPAAQATNPAS